MTGDFHVKLLDAADADAYWRLRLEALEQDPEAFGSAAEEHRAADPAGFAQRVRAEPGGSFVVGAFRAGRLLGTARLVREPGVKVRHKAQVQGVYVTQAARGQGVGKALMHALLERARSYDGLQQLTLSVMVPQGAARQLYRSLGFMPWGVEPRAVRVDGAYLDKEHLVLWLPSHATHATG